MWGLVFTLGFTHGFCGLGVKGLLASKRRRVEAEVQASKALSLEAIAHRGLRLQQKASNVLRGCAVGQGALCIYDT